MNANDLNLASPVIRPGIGKVHFAALEPSINQLYHPVQLKAFMALSLLFNKEVSVTDTQLGDNPHLLKEHFEESGDGLLAFMQSLAQEGMVRILLRNSFLVDYGQRELQCDTFSDVYRTWITQDMPGAWVVKNFGSKRESYYKKWDKIFEKAPAFKYDYQKIKYRFMERVREWYFSTGANSFKNDQQKSEYEMVLERGWFSYSDIYRLLKTEVDQSIIHTHGLIDEHCYASARNVDVAGCHISPNGIITSSGDRVRVLGGDLQHSLDDVFNEITTTIDLPALSALASLTAEDIIDLRSERDKLLKFIHSSTLTTLDQFDQIQNEWVSKLTEYWAIICDFLATKYPEVSRERNRLGIIAQNNPFFSAVSSSTCTILLALTTCMIPDDELRIATQDSLQRHLEKFTFKFFLTKDTQRMKKLRSSLPDDNWIASLAEERRKEITRGGK